MLIEGQPLGKLVNQVRSEVTFGQFDEVNPEDFVELFLNFSNQIGLDLEEIKELIATFDEEEHAEGEVDSEHIQDITNFLQERIEDKQQDIKKIVSQEDNRTKFLEQVSNNTEMLKEVFRLYLQDTLELYTNE